MTRLLNDMMTWYAASRATSARLPAHRAAPESLGPDQIEAALEARRRRYLSRMLPSPDAEAIVERYLASPEGRRDTDVVVARMTGVVQPA